MNESPSPSARRRVARALTLVGVLLVPIAFAALTTAALAGVATASDRIPAAVVNDDELVTIAPGTDDEQIVLAGRLLVTELVGSDDAVDWQLSNADAARDLLARGEVYAVVTIPSGFSAAIASAGSADASQAEIALETSSTGDYLAETLLGSVTDAMDSAFGESLTQQYLDGLTGALGELVTGFRDAADGTSQLAEGSADAARGAAELDEGGRASAEGARDLAAGSQEIADGAAELTAGLREYVAGVGELSAGLGEIAAGAAGLGAVGEGVVTYSAAVTALASGIAETSSALARDPGNIGLALQLQVLSAQLEALVAEAAQFGEAAAGIELLTAALAVSAGGANELAVAGERLAAGSAELGDGLDQLTGGTDELANGLDRLASGTGELASGLDELAEGSDLLASGLGAGAEQLPDLDGASGALAPGAGNPVALVTDAETGTGAPALTTGLIPVAAWLGALVLVLLARPLTASELASTASTGRLLRSVLLRGTLIAVVQAVAIVGVVAAFSGLGWTAVPAVAAFAALIAVAFVALHVLLWFLLERRAVVASLVLLAVQLATTGGIYPAELLPAPFSQLSPVLPFGQAVAGIQAIVSTGGASGAVVGAVGYFVVLTVGLGALCYLALRGARSARAIGFVPA